MATTVKANGDWLVDVGDQLTQDFDLTENGGPVDNWDDVVVQVDVFSARYGTLTLRSDDASSQVIKQAAAPATTVSVTLTEADTSANYTAKYRIVVIDPTEDERTTHQAAGFRIIGNYADIAPISFSPVTTPIPDAVVSSTIDAYLAAYTPAFLDTDDIGVTVEAAGAAAAAQAHAVQRSNHTGTQAQSTVTNLVSDLAAKASQASPTFTGTVTVPTGAVAGAAVNKAQLDALSGTYLQKFGFPKARGAVCFTFDDAYAADYDVAVALAARNQRAMFAIHATAIGTAGRLTASQIAEMQDMGHEMAFHSYDHTNLTTITAAQRVSTGQYNAAPLETIIGRPVTTYVLPQGGGSDAIHQELYLRYDRIVKTTSGRPFVPLSARDGTLIWRTQVDSTAQHQEALEMIRMTGKQPWIFCTYGHNTGSGSALTTAQLNQMFDLCADLDIPCLTTAEAFPSNQMLVNPGFESGLVGWTVVNSSGGVAETVTDTPDTALGGTKSLRLSAPVTTGEISARSVTVPITHPGQTFWFGGRVRTNITSGAGTIGIRMVQLHSDGVASTITNATTTATSWATLASAAVVLNGSTRHVRIDAYITGVQGEAWFDHIYAGPGAEKPVLG